MQTQEKLGHIVTRNIIISSGQAAGLLEYEQDLDNEYDLVDAVGALENAGSSEIYQIGIFDSTGKNYINVTNKELLLTTKSVAQNDKLRPINIPIKSGRKAIVKIKILATTSTDINLDVIFNEALKAQY